MASVFVVAAAFVAGCTSTSDPGRSGAAGGDSPERAWGSDDPSADAGAVDDTIEAVGRGSAIVASNRTVSNGGAASPRANGDGAGDPAFRRPESSRGALAGSPAGLQANSSMGPAGAQRGGAAPWSSSGGAATSNADPRAGAARRASNQGGAANPDEPIDVPDAGRGAEAGSITDPRVDPGAMAIVRRMHGQRGLEPLVLRLEGLRNQSHASNEAFARMQDELAAMLDTAARAAGIGTVLGPEGRSGAGGAVVEDPCALGGAAYQVAGADGQFEWELFLKLRCPREPTWSANAPVRLRRSADGGRSLLIVPPSWLEGAKPVPASR
ncbi:MAG: hypothetical protein U0575_13020 [Phycisphaerales bacterium]